MTKQSNQPIFYLLSIFHIGSVLTGLTMTSRMILINMGHPFYVTGGIFFVPVTFFIQDIATEVYGYYNARRMLHTTLIAFSFYTLALYLIAKLPCQNDLNSCQGFSLIANAFPRLALSFLLSLAIGGTINNYILAKLKLAFHSKFLAFRFISSTAIGEAVFQFIAVLIAWYGTYSFEVILPLAMTSYLYKLFFEVIATPINIKLCRYLKSQQNRGMIHAF